MASPVSVVQTAYRFDLGTREWLRELGRGVEPLIGGGNGWLAFEYALTDAGRLRVDASASEKLSGVARTAMLGSTKVASPELVRPVYVKAPALSSLHEIFGERVPRVHDALGSVYARLCPDIVGLNALGPTGVGVLINAPHSRRARFFDRATKERWSRVAAHIANALRLRHRLREPDAVVDPETDRVVHAEGEAKSAGDLLRAAARRVDRAQSRTVDADAALEMWQGLVDGTWSLVERFESDGRRFLVACRNQGLTPDPRALSVRQRQVVALAAMGKGDRLIAYTLGISESSVRTHLNRAIERLGLGGRSELIRFVRFVSADDAG